MRQRHTQKQNAGSKRKAGNQLENMRKQTWMLNLEVIVNLYDLGWNKFFEACMKDYEHENYSPGRIAKEFKNLYWIYSEKGEEQAILSDKLFMSIFSNVELPAVGDWVVFSRKDNFEKLVIEKVLPRQTKFSRKGKNTYGRNFSKEGSSEEQIISANVNTVFLVMSLDRDFNERKLERYLTLVWDSGSEPVIVLNKADQCDNTGEYKARAENVSCGVPVLITSAENNEGIDELRKYIIPGKTITLTGSSGVGKSSLINCIAGEEKQYVSHVREGDKRGRHTTTNREMIILPEGGILIDNPGMRDIKLSVDEEILDKTFSDITELFTKCRFRNCRHETEPGCAVREALENGSLSYDRWENYLKLQREALHYTRRKKQREKFIDNARSMQKHKGLKIKKHRRKGKS